MSFRRNRNGSNSKKRLQKFVYLQIGAGAGDQDASVGYRDGFTEFVKSLDASKIEKVLLVEPNPVNIPALRTCWKDYPQAEILDIGIRPSSMREDTLRFFYAEEDGPHFQVFSMNQEHVRKFCPGGTIRHVDVPTIPIKKLFDRYADFLPFEVIAVDMEGIDGEVLLDVDWSDSPCRRLSFEYVHLGEDAKNVYRGLSRSGYVRTGWGLGGRFDLIYEKPDSISSYLVIWGKWLLFGWWTIYRRPFKKFRRRLRSDFRARLRHRRSG